MKFFAILSIFIIGLTTVSAQIANINCGFVDLNGFYTCQIAQISVPDSPNLNFVIGGNHLPGRGNAQVQRIVISNANIPFIISQLFVTFPNVIVFDVNSGGLTRIQPNAFANAGNLLFISFNNNANFRTLGASAFAGASQLISINLVSNGIGEIHENAFVGASTVTGIVLSLNRIQELPARVFAPLNLLVSIFVNNNLLTSLDGRLFANNRQLRFASFSWNNINAIGRNFLDGLNSLEILDLTQNVCVNASWNVGGSVTLDTIRQALNTCFNNAVEPPPDHELRRFILEVRGPLSLRFENGTQIVTV